MFRIELSGLTLIQAVAIVALSLCFGACSREVSEERARQAEKEVRDSLGPDVDATAVAQDVSPELIKEVQTNLTAIHEYKGEINGTLDSVTVNAIEAFQRSAGLPDNGLINPRTRERLQAAAAAAKAKGPASAGAS